MRAPFQVLVFPYRKNNNDYEFCIFKREDHNVWQGIAGGGEDNESKLEAAKRESFEEAGISLDSQYIELDAMSTIPVKHVTGEFTWGEDVYVIPEYSFGVNVDGSEIKLSHEHTEFKWIKFEKADEYLKWDSNKTALWELYHRLN